MCPTLLHAMQHDGLRRTSAAPAPTTATAVPSDARSSCTTRTATTARAAAATPSATTASSEYSRGKSERVVIGHFEVPCHTSWLSHPRDLVSLNGSAFDVEDGRVTDL